MSKKCVDSGLEGFSPVVVCNTPEKEISCGDSVVVEDPKGSGGSELFSAQNELSSVEICFLKFVSLLVVFVR